jgi:hypothetical protein
MLVKERDKESSEKRRSLTAVCIHQRDTLLRERDVRSLLHHTNQLKFTPTQNIRRSHPTVGRDMGRSAAIGWVLQESGTMYFRTEPSYLQGLYESNE